jgi:hypothetical protein
MSNPSTGTLRSLQMNTQYKPYTIDELCQTIWEENLEHFEYMSAMSAGDCDCRLCTAFGVIYEYGGIDD